MRESFEAKRKRTLRDLGQIAHHHWKQRPGRAKRWRAKVTRRRMQRDARRANR